MLSRLLHLLSQTYWGNVNPIGERSCYDEGKRTAETLAMDYHRQDGVEASDDGRERCRADSLDFTSSSAV